MVYSAKTSDSVNFFIHRTWFFIDAGVTVRNMEGLENGIGVSLEFFSFFFIFL